MLPNRCVFSCSVVLLVQLITLRLGECWPSAENEEFPFPKQCGLQLDDDKIFNGVLARLDEFPWMALLKYHTEAGVGYGCGGALISKRYVLTAAHCVVGKFGLPIEVTLGEYDVNTAVDCTRRAGYEECADPPQFIQVEEVIKHPEFVKDSPQKLHDIALIRLKSSPKYTDFIRPICVPTEEIQKDILNTQGRNLDVAGWGRTKLRPASNIKRKARLPVVDNETCSKNRTIKIADTQICAGGGIQDSCSGDSGGPLMGIHVKDFDVHWYVAGIVSFGLRQCGTEGVASVYTNVASYRDWIIKTMKP